MLSAGLVFHKENHHNQPFRFREAGGLLFSFPGTE